MTTGLQQLSCFNSVACTENNRCLSMDASGGTARLPSQATIRACACRRTSCMLLLTQGLRAYLHSEPPRLASCSLQAVLRMPGAVLGGTAGSAWARCGAGVPAGVQLPGQRERAVRLAGHRDELGRPDGRHVGRALARRVHRGRRAAARRGRRRDHARHRGRAHTRMRSRSQLSTT